MLAFESLTPQELLKEVAGYLRQRAAQYTHAATHARTQRDKGQESARANALTLAAMDLESAGILPANSILREAPVITDPRYQFCTTCGHSHEDHDSDAMGGQCWNGSGHGNRCDCHQYTPAPSPEKLFTVGRSDTTGTVTRHATLAEAEAQIVEIEKTDPAGVHAGDYYVDGPEELINPNPHTFTGFGSDGFDINALPESVEVITDEDEPELLENPACPACDGPGVPLSSLGSSPYFRCRNCGTDFLHVTMEE